ncbi:MAG: adenylate kinase [Clostridia bacterium]|nr:adenylate kinase [Clostridia bacterium]
MRLILLGAPGAGKGTQAERISEKYNIPTVSTGNLLRAAVAAGTELGMKAKSYMDSGSLVPDELVVSLLAERIAEDDCKNGFILDGFPRSVRQAEVLEEMGVTVDKVLSLEVTDENIIARLAGRRACLKCGATYHIESKPPVKEGVCDKCGAELIIRDDDKVETIQKRLETFHSQTEPLKDFYGKKGILRLAYDQFTPDANTAEVFKQLQ